MGVESCTVRPGVRIRRLGFMKGWCICCSSGKPMRMLRLFGTISWSGCSLGVHKPELNSVTILFGDSGKCDDAFWWNFVNNDECSVYCLFIIYERKKDVIDNFEQIFVGWRFGTARACSALCLSCFTYIWFKIESNWLKSFIEI